MENTEEKLDNIEQLIELFISKQKLYEEKLDLLIKNEPVNYEKSLSTIIEILLTQRHEQEFSALNNQLQSLINKSAGAPAVIPVKHYHNFDFNSKPYFTGLAIIITTFIFSIGFALYMYSENQNISAEADKFKVIRGSEPGLALAIDSLYLIDSDNLLKEAEKQILVQKQAILATEKERNAKSAYEKAKAETKALKPKNIKKSR